MEIKKVILSIVFILALTVSLCWAMPPLKLLLSDMRGHTNSAQDLSKDIELLATRINKVSIEIKALSHEVDFKLKRDKILLLEEKVDMFRQWVLELNNKTDILKGLAGDLQNESKMLLKASRPDPDIKQCGPGTIWIPGHREQPHGKWIPGHCARK